MWWCRVNVVCTSFAPCTQVVAQRLVMGTRGYDVAGDGTCGRAAALHCTYNVGTACIACLRGSSNRRAMSQICEAQLNNPSTCKQSSTTPRSW